MLDMGGDRGRQHLPLAESLGLEMARRAADILDRHREASERSPGGGHDPARYAADDAIFTAVLDATNDCLGRFDDRPPEDRWCDALLQLILLAQLAAGTA
jgi:hypothetical protein